MHQSNQRTKPKPMLRSLASSLPIPLLLILTVFGLVLLLAYGGDKNITSPAWIFSAILVVFLAAGFVAHFKKRAFTKVYRRILYLFMLWLSLPVYLVATGYGKQCQGFWGAYYSCIETNALAVFFLIYNPLSLCIAAVLTIIAVVSQFRKMRK